jgi:DNA-binding LacI/PurR family transcriptional regulator
MEVPLDRGITAIVASNDQMALGLLKALRLRGVDVPGDVSVVGFDDIAESKYFHPALTTIAIDFEGAGRLAMDRLLCLIDSDRVPQPERPHPAVLVERESTAPNR